MVKYLVILATAVAFLAIATEINAKAVPEEQERQFGKRLIRFKENDIPQWLTLTDVDDLASKHINFMDITDQPKSGVQAVPKVFTIPTTLRFPTQVQAAISKMSTSRMTTFLTAFSAYFNRYYTTDTGVASSEWLMSQVQESIATIDYSGSVGVFPYVHSGWPQRSIIVRIQGTAPNATSVVILGAHLDSVTSGATGAAPGADDNGTGSTTLLEAFRALLESGFIPKRTIEFHWYAAEEVGLRGSQDLALAYNILGIDVVSMFNFDMSGYLSGSEPRIGFVTDYTDPELTGFLRKVVDGYSQYGWIDRTCGYACSDHAAWHGQGVRAAFAHEDGSNPYVHTINDTIENVNINHVLEFTKVAVGYAIEVAEPAVSSVL